MRDLVHPHAPRVPRDPRASCASCVRPAPRVRPTCAPRTVRVPRATLGDSCIVFAPRNASAIFVFDPERGTVEGGYRLFEKPITAYKSTTIPVFTTYAHSSRTKLCLCHFLKNKSIQICKQYDAPSSQKVLPFQFLSA